MGKGEIISGGALGQYSVRLKLDRIRIDADLVELAEKIAILIDYIAGLDEGPEKDSANLRKVSAEKRVQYLNDNIEDDPVVSAWCADLTVDLAPGLIGTIEVPGERVDVPVIIRPGYQGAAVFSEARDGQLQPALGGTPSGVIFNLCMMPVWQKWKPIFRLGEITAKTGGLCDVDLDPAIFSDRGSGLTPILDVNQAASLSDVPVEYMECDDVAFLVGDRVVVQFTGQDWSAPKIIGFESNPVPCAGGVLIIKITGTYYEGTYPNQTAKVANDLYLVWNGTTDAALLVKKSGGGYWDYPLTDADYSGDYADDLALMFGEGLDIAPPAPLFSLSGIVSNMDISWETTGFGFLDWRAIEVIREQKIHQGMAPGDATCKSFSEAEAIACMDLKLAGYESVPKYYYEPNGSVPNEAGGNDTWSDEVGHSFTEHYSGYTYTVWEDDPGIWFGALNSDGHFIVSNEGERSLSFSAPIGGVPSADFYLGYMAAEVPKVPPPAMTTSLKLGLLNSSGGDDVVVGPAISYAGNVDYSRSHDTHHYDITSTFRWHATCLFASAMSGTGTLTFLSGVEKTISASLIHSGEVENSLQEPPGVVYYWPTPYAPQKVVDFAISDTHIAHGYDTDENMQVLVVVETQESGHMATNLSDPGEPYLIEDPLHWSEPIEDDPVVTGRVVDYHIPFLKYDLVPDADLGNPWDLPDNEDLKTALYSGIDSFLAANGLDDVADRWVIKPEIEILKW